MTDREMTQLQDTGVVEVHPNKPGEGLALSGILHGLNTLGIDPKTVTVAPLNGGILVVVNR